MRRLLDPSEPSPKPYAVELSMGVSAVLFSMPVAIAIEIQRRLAEVAEIAATAGGLGFVVMDGVGATLTLRVAGHVVTYEVSDSRRVLTVIGVVPDESGTP